MTRVCLAVISAKNTWLKSTRVHSWVIGHSKGETITKNYYPPPANHICLKWVSTSCTQSKGKCILLPKIKLAPLLFMMAETMGNSVSKIDCS